MYISFFQYSSYLWVFRDYCKCLCKISLSSFFLALRPVRVRHGAAFFVVIRSKAAAMRWQSSRNTSHESALQVPQHLPLSLQIRLICMPLEDRIYLRRCARISTRWTSNCVAINLVLIDLIALAVMVAHQAYVILPLKAYVILPLKLHKPIASSQGKCYLR